MAYLGPAARPGKLVQASTGGARTDPSCKPRQQVEMAGGKFHHLVFQCIVSDQSQSLRGKIEYRIQIAIRRQTHRSEEHTSELQSLMRISYAVFCLKKKTISK